MNHQTEQLPTTRSGWAQWHLDQAIENGNPIMIARCRKYVEQYADKEE